jgi:hypothetical protein
MKHIQVISDYQGLIDSFGEEGMQLQSIKIQVCSKNSKNMFEF